MSEKEELGFHKTEDMLYRELTEIEKSVLLPSMNFLFTKKECSRCDSTEFFVFEDVTRYRERLDYVTRVCGQCGKLEYFAIAVIAKNAKPKEKKPSDEKEIN